MIVLTVAIVNLAIGPRTFRPSIFGKIATATYIVTAVVAMLFNYRGYHSLVVDVFVYASLAITLDLEPALHLARGADHRSDGGTRGRQVGQVAGRRRAGQAGTTSRVEERP